MKPLILLATAAALALPAVASAHIVFATAQAPAGTSFTGALRVGHGCAGSATVSLRVEIPEGVLSAKPQAKPGWTINVEHLPLKTPVPGEGGKMQTERVSAITWTGALPDDEFDDFAVLLKLPKAAGVLYFPATQVCQSGRADWKDIPVAGQAWHDVAHPAPVLTVTDGMAGMPGMDMGGMAH
jgi:uncharacterized protein YcnI